MRVIRVVAPDPNWQESYATEAARIMGALDDIVAAAHHIGSTSIPGIYAKPTIDILLVVDDLDALDAGSPAMVQLGYEVMGAYGIPGRRYFRKIDQQGNHTHHVHAFQVDHPATKRPEQDGR